MNPTEKNRLLVVDDDKSNLMALSHMLQPEYTIHVAHNGASALKIAEKYVPDLILLDIIMPDMDGYQVFSALQGMEKTAHIPVIFITGLNKNDDEKKGLNLGAVDYISKPFDDMIVKLRVQHQIRIINQLRTIEQLSMIDQVTGIYNRRHFDNRLRLEWGRALRDSAPVGLLMIDIDKFKIYNDTYGHLQGDAALRVVAQVLTQSLNRVTDLAARWGGEEFVVLLPNTKLDGCLNIGEQLRANIESEEIPCADGSQTKLTISIGVNEQTPEQTCSVDAFISNADNALYAAKQAGRNKVFLYDNAAGKVVA
jgi:diguanylate cyclase (GGDEF)-like protein